MEKALHLPTGQMYQCYTCGRHRHKSSECLVKAVLDQCGKRLEVDPETGYVTLSDRLPMNAPYKLRHDNEWFPFLRGQNVLKKRIMTLRDLDTLMRGPTVKSANPINGQATIHGKEQNKRLETMHGLSLARAAIFVPQIKLRILIL